MLRKSNIIKEPYSPRGDWNIYEILIYYRIFWLKNPIPREGIETLSYTHALSYTLLKNPIPREGIETEHLQKISLFHGLLKNPIPREGIETCHDG